MNAFLRKFTWWANRRRREDELREELEFHLANEADERQSDGLTEHEARWAARRDLGNVTLVREETRSLWSWILLEQLAQDVRYGLRTMFRNRLFTALATLSLALGIGANTAIYSFMDSILLRSLPVPDPASLVVVKWRSGPVNFRANEFVLHSIDGAPTARVRASRRRSFRSPRSSACRRPRPRSCPACSRTNRQEA